MERRGRIARAVVVVTTAVLASAGTTVALAAPAGFAAGAAADVAETRPSVVADRAAGERVASDRASALVAEPAAAPAASVAVPSLVLEEPSDFFVDIAALPDLGLVRDGNTIEVVFTVWHDYYAEVTQPEDFRVGLTVTWPAMLEALPVEYDPGTGPPEGSCVEWRPPGSATTRAAEPTDAPLVAVAPELGDACLLDGLEEPGSTVMFSMDFLVHDLGDEPGQFFGDVVGEIGGVGKAGGAPDGDWIDLDPDPVWDFPAEVTVAIAGRIGVDVQVDRELSWYGGPDYLVSITVTNFIADFESLSVPIRLGWPVFASRAGPSGCDSIDPGTGDCIITRIETAGEQATITATLTANTIGEGVVSAVGVDGGSSDCPVIIGRGPAGGGFGGPRAAAVRPAAVLPAAVAPRLQPSGPTGPLGCLSYEDFPLDRIGSDSEAVVSGEFEIRTHVEFAPRYSWPGGPDLHATITATRVENIGFEDVPVTAVLGLQWSYLFELRTDTATGCLESGAELDTTRRCTLAALLAGETRTIELDFRGPPADSPDRSGDGYLLASGSSLTTGTPDAPGDTLPMWWIGYSSDSAHIDEELVSLEVALDRDPVWQDGPNLTARITATRAERRGDGYDSYGLIAVGIVVEHPDFLTPTGPPDGCDDWNGTICEVVLERPNQPVSVDVEFTVGTGALTGVVAASAAYLVGAGGGGCSDGCGFASSAVAVATPVATPAAVTPFALQGEDLPVEWVVTAEVPVSRIETAITVDLVLDRGTGYTGGQPLTATATITRGAAGGVLPGLQADLRFTWPGFITKTIDTGCAPWTAPDTCTITGLDAPGSTAQVKLVFSMPPPSPPVPAVAPRTGDVVVAGLRLEFDAPPPTPLPDPEPGADPDWPPDGCYIDDSGLCVCDNPYEECGEPPAPPDPDPAPQPDPEPVDGTLPTGWIAGDREPFTLLQPAVFVAPSVSTPGEAVGAFASSLPPGARITLLWKGGGSADLPGVVRVLDAAQTSARLPVFVRRWQVDGVRTLVMHSVDGLFGDIEASNQLLIAPRSAMAPDLVGRGG
ncbi:hypothetical protein [Agromyces larvae]|uniref:DUF11 domain-containing protein n=1 Tax=Agromyces larvae TaxID=2929802 RepID=A0ABY4BYL9_9MICO|nr:hypothetical protein [Agromyces larvae]UOE43829.1 hypothetical protein MTO99_16920 [Agromyces larvae]